MNLHVKFLIKDGKKQFVVLPYEAAADDLTSTEAHAYRNSTPHARLPIRGPQRPARGAV
jgi:hypothetical protein